jgi:predicted nucleic acid-binding protein
MEWNTVTEQKTKPLTIFISQLKKVYLREDYTGIHWLKNTQVYVKNYVIVHVANVAEKIVRKLAM